MAELGGMLAAAILKVVGDQIGSAIEGQIKLQQDFTDDLEKMKMALESVEALLEDDGRRSITEKSTRLWLKRLKVAMYGISDMLDEFEAETQAFSSTQPSTKQHKVLILPLNFPRSYGQHFIFSLQTIYMLGHIAFIYIVQKSQFDMHVLLLILANNYCITHWVMSVSVA